MPILALAGDVMLGRGVNERLHGRRDPAAVWGDVLPLLLDADLRLVNLECALTRHRRPWSRTPKVFRFRADPDAAVAALAAARIDVAGLANDHALDYEAEGLLDTLRALDAAGIQATGAGRDAASARRPAVVARGGARVAVLAWTEDEPSFAAGPDRPGTCFLPISLAPHVLERAAEAIDAARARADLVVVSLHWGADLVQRPNELVRRFCRALVDRGADVVLGHGTHVFQGVEIHRDRPIVYGAGDFLDDFAIDPVARNDWSFLFRVAFDGGRFAGLEMAPVVLRNASVRRAGGEHREALLGRMRVLCEELGTPVARTGDRLFVKP
jgi:poly-gamma-glutamate synthesis protein (capsule biosynthesis protein)